MNKVDKFVSKYVIFTIPLVMILLIWGSADDPQKLSQSLGATRFFWDTLGWIFMIWILGSFYLVLKTVFSKNFRSLVLKKVSGIKERDEREALISGEAAKFSFLSTMAVLLLFLFLSIFTVTIGKHPKGISESNKRGFISIGMNFYPFQSENPKIDKVDEELEIFTYKGIPISSSVLILFLIFWLFGSYRIAVIK